MDLTSSTNDVHDDSSKGVCEAPAIKDTLNIPETEPSSDLGNFTEHNALEDINPFSPLEATSDPLKSATNTVDNYERENQLVGILTETIFDDIVKEVISETVTAIDRDASEDVSIKSDCTLSKKIEDLKKINDDLNKELLISKHAQKSLVDDLRVANENIEKLKSFVQGRKDQVESMLSIVDDFRDKENQLKRIVDELNGEKQDWRNEVVFLKEQLSQSKSELQVAKDLVEQFRLPKCKAEVDDLKRRLSLEEEASLQLLHELEEEKRVSAQLSLKLKTFQAHKQREWKDFQTCKENLIFQREHAKKRLNDMGLRSLSLFYMQTCFDNKVVEELNRVASTYSNKSFFTSKRSRRKKESIEKLVSQVSERRDFVEKAMHEKLCD